MSEILHWADKAAKELVQSKQKFCVATGISPSGHIHVGNLREVATADALVRALKDQGKETDFIYIADNYDPLRKVYPFLDEAIYAKEVGKPLSEIPAPDGSGKSYSDYFLEPFLKSLEKLDIKVRLVKADEMYKNGLYTKNVIKCFEKIEMVKSIIERITKKELSDDWTPFMAICESCERMDQSSVKSFDKASETISYSCKCGYEGNRKITGGGKLTWRLDWPARWEILGVTVEPFGKDHASRGGSFDTGKILSKLIFDYEAPYPTVYEWISLNGQGDMSSSKGNVISIADMIEVMPAEVLKYWIFRSAPGKHLSLDPGLPLLSVLDEFDDIESKNRNQRAIELSNISNSASLGVPFKHLVSLCQIYVDHVGQIQEALLRSGYPKVDAKVLENRVEYARRWLDRFAPENVKFEIKKDSLPEETQSLSDAQIRVLKYLQENYPKVATAESIHELLYAAKSEYNLEPKEVFEAVYVVILGQSKGPRAGFFLASLDQSFVLNRFKEAVASRNLT